MCQKNEKKKNANFVYMNKLKTVNSMLITGTITAKQKVRQKSQAFTRFAGRFQSHT